MRLRTKNEDKWIRRRADGRRGVLHSNDNITKTNHSPSLQPGHSAFDSLPWILALVDFVRQALTHPSVRVIGVCFGHQIVGRAMGAKVARSDVGWEISVCGVELSAAGKEVFEGRDTLVRLPPPVKIPPFPYSLNRTVPRRGDRIRPPIPILLVEVWRRKN